MADRVKYCLFQRVATIDSVKDNTHKSQFIDGIFIDGHAGT